MGNFKLIKCDEDGQNRFLITLAPPSEQSCFQMADGIAVEKFDSGWLIFNAETMMIYALDEIGFTIFEEICSGHSIASASVLLSNIYDAAEVEILSDVLMLSTEWEQNRIIKRIIILNDIENSDNGRRFVGKPGVSCRVEEPDGAILYDPQQNAFHVLNPTGLVIWQLLENRPSVKELVYELSQEFAEIPLNEVVMDIEQFLEDLIETSFVFEVTDELS